MRRISFLFATILSLPGINATPRSSSVKNNHSYNSLLTHLNTSYDTGLFNLTMPAEANGLNLESFSSYDDIENSSDSQLNSFEGDSFVPNKDFLWTYFAHLSENFPKNTMGVCGYTGISMLLSYYDSYWNDNFIDEKYDSIATSIPSGSLYSPSYSSYQSPGVWNNISPSGPSIDSIKKEIEKKGITNENSDEFKELLDRRITDFILEQIDSGTFLGNLFQIAVTKGILKSRFIPNCSVSDGEYLSGIGVNNYIMSTVLSGAIDGNFHTRGKVLIVKSKMEDDSESEKQRIRSEIVEIVKTGRPVLMGGNGYTDHNGNGTQDSETEQTFGHIAVAYYYDEDDDVLYGNLGWGSSYTCTSLDSFFNIQMSDYWALNLTNKLKKRSNNYIFIDKNAYYSPTNDRTYNIISPSDYGFPSSYGSQNIPTEHSFVLPNTNEVINTERLRCGFIEKECVNLSPKRYETGLAYLQLAFTREVKHIEVLLSWWSPNERVDPSDSIYTIDYLTPDNYYTTAVNLWTDVDLSTDRAYPTHVNIDFPADTNDIVFYAQCRNPLNDRNKGRLSIGKMLVEYW